MSHILAIGTADVMPLMMEITRQPQLWKADTYLRDYPQGPFGDTETIFLRFPPASVTELERGERDQHECVWMDGAVHLPAARPLIFQLMTRVAGERLGRVMINKIRPGGRIVPHADTPVHAEYWDRHHIVLQSDKGATFRVGDETVHMPTGTVWWFQNKLEHEARNGSAIDRIHMVIDIRTYRIEARALLPTKAAP
jgi:hypothetical protein